MGRKGDMKKFLIIFKLILMLSISNLFIQDISLTSIMKDTPTVRSLGMGNSYTGVAEAEGALFLILLG